MTSDQQERCHVGARLSDESAQHDAECPACFEAASYEVRPFGLLSCVLRMISAHVSGDESKWRNYGEFLCQQIEQDGPDSRATAERFRKALRGDLGTTVHAGKAVPR